MGGWSLFCAWSQHSYMAWVLEKACPRVVMAVLEAHIVDELNGKSGCDGHAESQTLLQRICLHGRLKRAVDCQLDADTDEQYGDCVRLPQGEMAGGHEARRADGALGSVLGGDRLLMQALEDVHQCVAASVQLPIPRLEFTARVHGE